eukprot:4101459-Pyramimonas_sp.AAC.1
MGSDGRALLKRVGSLEILPQAARMRLDGNDAPDQHPTRPTSTQRPDGNDAPDQHPEHPIEIHDDSYDPGSESQVLTESVLAAAIRLTGNDPYAEAGDTLPEDSLGR